ncbi:MAG: DNA primase [Bacteroidetes bacterium]|nr:DNA primase [Bacteroidota bacterium]
MITENSLDQLLSVVAIEQVVGDYVTLRKSGSRYTGLCPFHDEKTPSFSVTPSMGIYKCFGCNKGGNAIQFVREIENVTFVEAARQLAERYGVELIETGNRLDDDQYQELQRRKEGLQVVLDYAQGFFQQQLNDTEEGAIGLSYFKERGYSKETRSYWGLGYSPSAWDALLKDAEAKGYKKEKLQEVGLVKQKDKGNWYDLYRGRVIFPLKTPSGKIVGFAGRKMDKAENSPKYVNSPETELYKKSDFLYGVFEAKQAIGKEDNTYLVEGYTDVITLWQSGIRNAVASSGTALTPGQIKLIRKFSANITVLYDGDAAGIKASLRGIDLLLAESLNVKVVALPQGEDPDSFCQKLGGEAFGEYIKEEAQNFIFFKAQLLLDQAAGDPIKKSEAIKDVLQSVSLISDSIKRSVLTRQLAAICQVEEAVLTQELGLLLRKSLRDDKNSDALVKQAGSLLGQGAWVLPEDAFSERHQEAALFRLFLLYGNQELKSGQSVLDYTLDSILDGEEAKDQLGDLLKTELFQRIWTDMLSFRVRNKDTELANRWPEPSFYIHHEEAQVSAWAADVLSRQYVLSPTFEEHYIYIKEESDSVQIVQSIEAIVANWKRIKVEKDIQEALFMLETAEGEEQEHLMSYLLHLNGIKLNISKSMGTALSGTGFGNKPAQA